jgi:internalin A
LPTLRLARFAVIVALPFLAEAPARAATPEEAAEWLRSLNVPLADAKGFVAATPESIAEVKWVSFARVPAGKLNVPDLAKLKALPKLEEIVFGGNTGSDAGVEEIAKAAPHLRKLWLFRSAVTDAAFRHVATLTELESLHLAGTRISASALVEVARLKKLRALELDDTDVGDAGLEAIKAMPALAEISFKDMRGVGARGMAALASMRRLDSLHLGFAEIDDSIEKLAASRTLRQLFLMRATVTDARAAQIAKIKSLRVLALSYTPITDGALAHVASLPQLATLELVSTKITDDGVKALSQMKTLSVLDLTDTATTDASMDALIELPKLTSLVLRGTKVTNAGAEKLARAKSLKHVDLAGTAVTEEGVKTLAKALPEARVVGNEQ